MKTDNYKEIVNFLKPSNEVKTVCCAKFSLFMAKMNKTFLTQLQHQKPMIHKLYELCCQLVLKFMNLIVKPDKIPTDGPALKALNLDDKNNLLPASSCNFGEGVKSTTGKLKAEDKPKMMEALRQAVVENVKYLQKNLPLGRKLYANLRYLNPLLRKNQNLKTSLRLAAKITKRFSDQELDDLASELSFYQLMEDDKLPMYDDDNERLDIWYRTVFGIMEKEFNQIPAVFKKLVKMTLPLAHGNAFLERGFNLTKQITSGRESMNIDSVKGQKTVKDVVTMNGGSDKVPVDFNTINAVKMARMSYQKALELEKEEKKRQEELEKQAKIEKRRREKNEEEERHWSVKVRDLETKAKSYEEKIKVQEALSEECMKRALDSKDKNTMKSNIEMANIARQSISENTAKLVEAQKKLQKLLHKKPKNN